MGSWMCSGLDMHFSFNETLTVFVPKGTEEEDDKYGITRDPTATRPIGLKNSDVKTVSATMHTSIKPSVARSASRLQNGSIMGRGILDNIVDLDTHARGYSMRRDLQHPLLLFTDFGAAFPSLLHQWIFTVASESRLPLGLQYVIRCIHSFVIGVWRAGLSVKALFPILRGVIQRCPLAAFCFVLAFGPFLSWMNFAVVQRGLGYVRACADDVGCALSSIEVLPTIAAIFNFARLLAGLAVKFHKCRVVPVRPWSSDSLVSHGGRAMRQVPRYFPRPPSSGRTPSPSTPSASRSSLPREPRRVQQPPSTTPT